ncbi:MAG: hypothetical protein C4576_16800 [Desulfobacteraceae bacterium]|nr:MAG: hypothetical protein C4576_16800 [Desulfobacteraceae bacterium]
MEVKKYLMLMNVVLTALIAWAAYNAYVSWSAERQKGSSTSRSGISQPVKTAQANPSAGLSYYQSIITNDIFGTTRQKPAEQIERPKPAAEIPVSRRNLSLRGTVVGRDNNSYAVISESRSPEGEVFRVNDLLQNARILEILPDRVILEAEGKQEVLIITFDLKTEGNGTAPERQKPPSGAAVSPQSQRPSPGKPDRSRLPGKTRPPARK